MNQSVKNTLIFLTGAAVGSVSTWFAVKKYYELKSDLEVESVRDAYDRKINDAIPSESTLDGSLVGPENIDDGEEKVHLDDAKSSISKKLNNKPPLTDYTKYFKSKDDKTLTLREITRDPSEDMIEAELAEAECPPDDEPYTDEEDENETLEFEGYQLNGAHKKAVENDKPPYIIDKSDYELTCSNYEKMSPIYYIYDNVLVDDDEILDREEIIGNLIESSGFDNNEDDSLYVRNDKLMTDYEIIKVYKPYSGE